MSLSIIEIIFAIVLLLQGLSHGKALIDLIGVINGRNQGVTLTVEIWLRPSLAPKTAALIAAIFWFLATLGFVVASLGALENIEIGVAWRPLAAVAAIISTIGIVLVGGTWPAAHTQKLSRADTIIALAINAAIIVYLIITR